MADPRQSDAGAQQEGSRDPLAGRLVRPGDDALLRAHAVLLLGELTTGLAHDAGNSLVGIRFLVSDLASDGGAPQEGVVGRLERGCDELEQLLETVREFGTLPEEPSPLAVGLGPRLGRLLGGAARHPGIRQVELTYECAEGDLVVVDPRWLGIAVLELVLNATLACGEGGRVHVSTLSEGERLILCVDDDGPGFPEGVASEALMEPLRTVNRPRRLGLGLWCVRQRVRLMGGELTLEASPMGGARCRLALPRG